MSVDGRSHALSERGERILGYRYRDGLSPAELELSHSRTDQTTSVETCFPRSDASRTHAFG